MDPCNFGAPATTVSNRQILDDFVPQFTHLLTVSTATLDPKYIDTTNEYYQFLHPRIPPNSHKKRDNRGEGTNQSRGKNYRNFSTFGFSCACRAIFLNFGVSDRRNTPPRDFGVF
jgi:hypothetical protein